MAEMDELIKQASALGESIARHPTVAAFTAARDKVQKDPSAQELLAGYAQQADRIHELEATGKPIEVDDKHKMAQYEQSMASNDALKALMRAQTDYVDLMNKINRAMEEPLNRGPKSNS